MNFKKRKKEDYIDDLEFFFKGDMTIIKSTKVFNIYLDNLSKLTFKQLEYLLNYSLSNINSLNDFKYFKYINNMYLHNVDNIPSEIINSYSLINKIINQITLDDRFRDIYEVSEEIANNLIRKKISINGYSLNENIKVKNIIDYSIPYSIDIDDTKNIIIYVIIYTSLHYYILRNNR